MPEGTHYPQMLVGTLYDVLAKISDDVIWGPYRASERDMARMLMEEFRQGDLVLFDRGFPSFELLETATKAAFEAVFRLPKDGMFSEVRGFLASGGEDGLVTISPPKELVRERSKTGYPPAEPVTVRIVKGVLPKAAEPAIFATTLLDREACPASQVADLSHLGWEEEVFFELLKGLLASENSRGENRLFVDQEPLSIYLYSVLTRLLMMECARRHRMAPETLSQRHAFLAVSRCLDRMLMARSEHEYLELVDRCADEIAWQSYRKRPAALSRDDPRQATGDGVAKALRLKSPALMGDHLRSSVMPVEPGLCHKNSNVPADSALPHTLKVV